MNWQELIKKAQATFSYKEVAKDLWISYNYSRNSNALISPEKTKKVAKYVVDKYEGIVGLAREALKK